MSAEIAKRVRHFAKGLRVTAYNGQAGMLLNESARHLGEAADALDAKDKRIAELEAGGWQPIEAAPKDGTRFLAAEWDGQGWVIGPCLWCKTPHVPLYGFHFTEGDPENWEMANPQFHQPLPAPPSPEGEANG